MRELNTIPAELSTLEKSADGMLAEIMEGIE